MTRTRLRNAVVGGLCAAALLAAALTSCGDDEGSEAPPVKPVSLDQLIEACIVTNGCGVQQWPKISNCVVWYYDRVPQGESAAIDKIYHCVVAAEGDCTKVFECYGSNRYAGSCNMSNYTATCDKDQRFTCDSIASKVFIFDCTAAKLSCKTSTSKPVTAHCTRGSCDSKTFTTKCEGDTLVSCLAGGVMQTDDCSSDGGRCKKSATGALSCIGNQDKTCDLDPTKPPYQASCAGHTAVTCKNNNVNKEDCSKRPYKKTCQIGRCVFVGSECTEDDFNRCKGDKLEYCAEGKWNIADCAAMNLGACKTATNGANCSAKNW